LNDAEATHRQRLAVFELAVERARFEADRARRQFDAVEPENRLVARTLEAAWETALSAQRQAEADLLAQRTRQPTRLSADEIHWLSRAGADVRAVFNASTTTWRQRKQLLRAVVAEVVVTVRAEDRQADVRIIWEGGAHNELVLALNKPGGHFRATDEGTVALVRRLAERYDDTTIATILSQQRRRTGAGLPFTRSRVCSLRHAHDIAVFQPDTVTPRDDDDVVVTIYQAEKLLGVDKSTIYRWLNSGFITGEQLTAGGPWHLRISDELRKRVVPDVPDGWLTLDQAARHLGVARQTVLHKVQRGELAAVHVTTGKRKGLRIQVEPATPGLFTPTQ
jgi:excisionase family DNA binding protein